MARTNSFETFDNILPRYICSLSGKKKYSEQVVFFYWDKIIGKDVANHVKPDRFSFNTLFLAADSPVWASQLSIMKEEIKDKINTFVGEALVKDIRFNASFGHIKRQTCENQSVNIENKKTSQPSDEEIKKAENACMDIGDEKVKKAAEKALTASLALNRDRLGEGWHKCEKCGHLCPPKEKFCPTCQRDNKKNVEKKIREKLAACPWSSYGEIYKYVPCSAQQANSQRAAMLQKLAGKLVYGDFESIDAMNFVMLADCVMPKELNEERVKKVMKRFRWMMIQPTDSKRNTGKGEF